MKRLFASLLCATTLVIGIAPRASAANTVPATPTRDKGQSVYLGVTRVYPTGYNIANNNYFKLRDVGTLVGFGVEWNGQTQTVEISTERIPSSTEGIADQAVNGAAAKLSSQRITVDGTEVQMTAYQIGGNNYVKLRDIGKAVNFDISFDSASRRITINKEKPYQEPASGNAITSWNSTMQKFHAAMADCNWQAEKYLAVAEQYAPAIIGKQNGTVRDVIAALDGMKGAPVDAISFDDKPVSVYWANELRMALGDSVDVPTDNNYITVTDEMLRAWELEMVDCINEERAKIGLHPLTVDQDLMKWSQFWAQHLATVKFEHSEASDTYAWFKGVEVEDVSEPDGSFFLTEEMGKEIEHLMGGENIAGAVFAEEDPVTTDMKGFMASEGHRNTILAREWTRVGVGFAVAEDGRHIYCTQSFVR